MALWTASHAFAILVFALACYGAGKALVARIAGDCPIGQRVAFSTALGMGLIGTALFVLGMTGSFSGRNVWIVLIVAILAGWIPPWRVQLRREDLLRGLVLLAATGTLFLLALYPPTGFDATMYHLPYARLFASAEALVFADTLRFPVFPQLGEMPFTAALLLADDTAAQLTQWLALFVTVLAVTSVAYELGGRAAGVLAAGLWIGSPLALYLGANAYIDASLAMFVTLAFAAWLRWRRDPGALAWLALAGAFAGWAAATKYHGLFFVCIFAAMSARRGVRAAAVFCVAALLFAAPWYVRITATTGNPVFPYASAIFGRHEWQTNIDARFETLLDVPLTGAESQPRNPLVTVVRQAVADRIARGEAPHNPWLVLLLPFAFVAAVVEPRLRFACVASLGYTLIVWSLDWRFVIAVAPLLSIAVAYALARTWSAVRPPRPAVLACAALLLAAPGLGWTTLLLRSFGPIPTRPAERDAFLTRRVHVYEALRFLARERPDAIVYLLHVENAAYYCPTRCLGELYGPYRYQYLDPLLTNPAALAAKLRSFGVDVLVRQTGGPPLEQSGAFRLLFRGWRAEAYAIVPEQSSSGAAKERA